MKKSFYTILLGFVAFSMIAQDRYLDEMFDVEIERGVEYAQNISVLTGTPAMTSLVMDVYTPEGDEATDRPVVLIAHTGTFLPPLFNQTTSGSRTDSTVVEIAKRLASMGFVAVCYDYRLGWAAASPDADVRLATILQAAYRGIIDTRTLVRFFHKTVAEDGNPYGIDDSKIAVWGIGTGGYLSLGTAALDRFEEVTLEKFRDVDGNTLVDTLVLGNFEGTNEAAINVPNYVDYSSDIQFTFNAGGAIGDSAWIEGNEPFMSGVHCTQDFFAPYVAGNVVVPTTFETIINVAGTWLAIDRANRLGTNDAISRIAPEDDPLGELIAQQKETIVVSQTAQMQPHQGPLGTDNFYGFDIPLVINGVVAAQGSPWDWWGLGDLEALVAATNAALGTSFVAQELHDSGLGTNPDMSAEKGRAYIDTIFMLASPRMYAILDLGDAVTSSEDILEEVSVGLALAPNPADNQVRFTSDADSPIGALQIFDAAGRQVFKNTHVNSSDYTWYRDGLSAGIFIAKVHFENGIVAKRLYLK